MIKLFKLFWHKGAVALDFTLHNSYTGEWVKKQIAKCKKCFCDTFI